ncbi:MAG: DUF3458 domain-containing protein, partial [Rhodobiaceae bacterium]|nr:DUF3458 domain-containing protein [Rhodobiaceae bacterium]
LKEGLTVFRDQEFSADMRSAAVKRIQDVRTLRAQQFPEDAGPLSHPVRPEKYLEINNFYTATVYEKGAEIIRMLRTLIGADAFKRGMDLYFARHDGEAATVDEFLACFAEVSDLDVDTFSRWYAQAGTPEVTLATTYDADARLLKIDLGQTTPATPGQDVKKPVPIPIRLGLVAPDGTDLPLVTNEKLIDGDTVLLDGPEKSFTFSNVEARPVVSPFRGFSAPVRIVHDVSPDDRRHLAMHDSDPFNRWQAVQDIVIADQTAAVAAIRAGKTPEHDDALVDILAACATDGSLDPAFRALLITPPSEADIAREIRREIDPEAIHAARQGLRHVLAEALEPTLSRLYDSLTDTLGGRFSPDAEQAGLRSLRNAALDFLGIGAMGTDRLIRHYEAANTMTDRIAALSLLLSGDDHDAAEKALAAFYDRYSGDPLVTDKWLMIQASAPGEDTPGRVRTLMRHPAFSMKTPNRVRALIGSFAMANQRQFNRADGQGFDLVGEVVLALDRHNPQVAARLLSAFRSWQALETTRRNAAGRTLRRIAATQSLSPDVRDIVDRTLSA